MALAADGTVSVLFITLRAEILATLVFAKFYFMFVPQIAKSQSILSGIICSDKGIHSEFIQNNFFPVLEKNTQIC